MNNLLGTVSEHGYAFLFLIVLAEACGFPVPAALALIAGGAAAAAHILSLPTAFAVAVCAMMIGDLLLFFLGRYTGWAMLAVLCRLSLNPETCILHSAESFYKYGRVTLLFAKFLPGVNTMAPPLAGSMKMRAPQFLQLDFLGASFYTWTYMGVGYVFRDLVVRITRGLQSASHAAAEVVLGAILLFVIYRIVQYRRFKTGDVVPRIGVTELARRLLDGKDDVVIVDVRSHGYYDSGASRIAGSIRLEPNRLSEELKSLPRDKDIFVYCT
jgi:membrane protein DedA with SNARE-associated domain